MQTICQHVHIRVQKVTRSQVYILPPKQAFLHRNQQGFAFVIHSTSLHCIKQSIAVCVSICTLKGFKGTTFLRVKVIANSGNTLGRACGFIY